ncbi:MAG: hypothetical protein GOV15_04205 [Candidatus Diapherotrites archaeon]|nr:hypothetical protein [Candidatus Diapherotrites archaeon]
MVENSLAEGFLIDPTDYKVERLREDLEKIKPFFKVGLDGSILPTEAGNQLPLSRKILGSYAARFIAANLDTKISAVMSLEEVCEYLNCERKTASARISEFTSKNKRLLEKQGNGAFSINRYKISKAVSLLQGAEKAPRVAVRSAKPQTEKPLQPQKSKSNVKRSRKKNSSEEFNIDPALLKSIRVDLESVGRKLKTQEFCLFLALKLAEKLNRQELAVAEIEAYRDGLLSIKTKQVSKGDLAQAIRNAAAPSLGKKWFKSVYPGFFTVTELGTIVAEEVLRGKGNE